MRKALVTLTSVAAIAAAAASVSTGASAYPAWVIPAIVGAGIGGVGLGAAAQAATYPRTYVVPGEPVAVYPAPTYVRPVTVEPSCYFVRERIRGVMRRVEICE
ncbi:hypothetical protein QNA08_05915 [Chelatococcus sp. SYSU_G07232]|uniref:Ecotin n=1 Tax=Chelatococcus albus TaxID=3047466 RepID=A0ABT7AF91_9HYPH|nr:hypothetical protein [Chelatococcus sp. SYSU_G07232]MDJ1157765.1 hypothetical protein [Chelatococcus sp. SYSU_G07232]